jgi:thiol-disulfide isomerase/thioredoxin
MICVAALMVADADTRFQTAIADDLPSFLVNPTGDLEENDAVASDLAAVSAHGGGAVEAGAGELDEGLDLPRLGEAPDFTGNQSWFNTEDGEALSLNQQLDGRVVLIDFWTYTCINCIRTLPYLKAWDAEYRDDGLTIVGVHSPEFPFEREADNVADAIEENELRYPVTQDNDFATWTAYGNQYWPAKYLIDAEGQVRFVHFGEGEYETTERAIRTLLREKGDEELGNGARASAEAANPATRTPETYLGSARAEGWINGPIRAGTQRFGEAPGHLDANEFAYSGTWQVTPDGATAAQAGGIDAEFEAEKVFLVLGSTSGPGRVRVLLDGEPVAPASAGEDVRGGAATVTKQRLYRLIDLPQAGRHQLQLRFEPGVSGYAFTFG